MKKRIIRVSIMILLAAFSTTLVAEQEVSSASSVAALARWYTPAQVEQGRIVFENHCAACHGLQAEGTTEWRKRTPEGHYPPPPLNGTAHAWHHSIRVLRDYINGGGKPWGGQMPAFEGQLSGAEVDSAIAFFQHFWSDTIYLQWLDFGNED
jgi:mono/diheme cytochrome c family protein